jgi:CBS domain-containing protein
LQLFGSAASEAVRTLLDERGIAVHTGAAAVELAEGELRLLPTGTIPADWAVALPRLHGPRIDGIPQTVDGFVSVDAHGRVRGAPDIFAAGDITTFPIKQGGIAAQQADAAAEMIALNAGAELVPEPFRPVLRGLLLTGTQPRYLRQSPAGGSIATAEPLWWPPTKIVGRYLAPFLALVAGVESPPEAPSIPGAVEVDRELELERIEALATLRLESRDSADDTPSVGSVMTTEFLVAAPEDTLGEVAERMSEQVARPALVSDHGVLIGILTSRDLLRAFAARVHPSDARVREWMTAEPVVVSSGTPLETAVTLMGQYDLNHLPVVDDERPVGILSLRQAVRRTRGRIGVGLGF